MMDAFLKSVVLIAKAKYEIDRDILEDYLETIQNCWDKDYTPRKTVEVIASDLFG